MGVFNDVDIREDDQTFLEHLFDEGQKCMESLGGVDGGKHD